MSSRVAGCCCLRGENKGFYRQTWGEVGLTSEDTFALASALVGYLQQHIVMGCRRTAFQKVLWNIHTLTETIGHSGRGRHEPTALAFKLRIAAQQVAGGYDRFKVGIRRLNVCGVRGEKRLLTQKANFL
jgi:hypothetical protein